MHLFFQTDLSKNYLDGEEARHCAKVLRLREGDRITLTDGNGTEILADLLSVDVKKCTYRLVSERTLPANTNLVRMAVCPTRKAERNEWMVEKMTELGVRDISFVVSDHTHHETIKRVLNLERLGRIAQSAMKQSQQYYLPTMSVFPSLKTYLESVGTSERYIAYLAEGQEPEHLLLKVKKTQPVSILIGPEGDFSKNEIAISLANGFLPVSLGPYRLRTETAAVAACHAANLAQIL